MQTGELHWSSGLIPLGFLWFYPWRIEAEDEASLEVASSVCPSLLDFGLSRFQEIPNDGCSIA